MSWSRCRLVKSAKSRQVSAARVARQRALYQDLRGLDLTVFGCACASPSVWRSRSICILSFAGNSRSSLNDARNPSPISRTMARLCLESMSIGFRMTAFQTGGNRRLWLSCASACFWTASPKTFGYPRHAPFRNGGRRFRTPIPRCGFSFRFHKRPFRFL